jgi:4-amino-4-deoxy-L-arabinose transferase-like glycosyltransferase
MTRRTFFLLVLLMLTGVFLRFWRMGDMPFFSDEAYYLRWADHLAPAYFDHPAGHALALRAGTELAGRSPFGARWLVMLLSVSAIPGAWLVGNRYAGEPGGLLGSAVVAVAPLYVIGGRVAYPDALQQALVLLLLVAIAPALAQPASALRWLAVGVAAGLLLNVKLTSILPLAGLALYLFVWRRDLLRGRGPWLAIVVALVMLAPFAAWNFQHEWPSVRLALAQGGGYGLSGPTAAGRAANIVGLLTLPTVLLAVFAGLSFAAWLRRTRAGLRPVPGPLPLACVALCSLVPVLLSRADNPRNLGMGLIAVWPLAGLAYLPAPAGWSRRAQSAALLLVIGLLAWMLVCSVGTVRGLLAPTGLPRSSAADRIRVDAEGWPGIGVALEGRPGPYFAVDYSIAGQMSFYLGTEIASGHGQDRIWGLPDLTSVTIVAQEYLPPELINRRLVEHFRSVSGPTWVTLPGPSRKMLLLWRVSGIRGKAEDAVESLDYLNLAREAQR